MNIKPAVQDALVQSDGPWLSATSSAWVALGASHAVTSSRTAACNDGYAAPPIDPGDTVVMTYRLAVLVKTKEQSRQACQQKLAGMVVALLWCVPTGALSWFVGNPAPLLVGLVCCMIHVAIVEVRQAKARKQRRRDFWAGAAPTADLPPATVLDIIRGQIPLRKVEETHH